MPLTERDRVLMTAEAQSALQAELEQLETFARREIAERIKTAREWGDLKENSEYHDAKNDQAHLETKILRIRQADGLHAGLAPRRGPGRGQDLVRLARGQGAGRLACGTDRQA